MALRVVSASRRTDIPAFYGDWLMNRIRAGWCAVPNPFNAKQVSRVELAPDQTVIVFWTRWPAPFMRHLAELDDRGYRYYFLVTLVDYPRPLEPQAPRYARSLNAFLRLADRIGPERVIWRYDPIVLSSATGADFHREHFSRISEQLQGATRQVVISLADVYPKLRGRLRQLAIAHPELMPRAFDNPADGEWIQTLAAIAHDRGMEIRGCAPEIDLRQWDVTPGKCIDDALVRQLFGVSVTSRKDKSQRAACGCIDSRDIGMYDSCLFGCQYCYATRSFALARHNHAAHDPSAESLFGGHQAPLPRKASAPEPPVQGQLLDGQS